MDSIRCFLGLKPDIGTVRALTDVQLELKSRFDEAGAKVNWVPPPNMHITIRFLGQITEPMAYAVKGMLKPIVSGINSFEMETIGLGVFPDENRPRVLWAGVNLGKEMTVELHRAVSERLVEVGFNLEDKPFSAHITIGRIKYGDAKPLTSFVEGKELLFGKSFLRNLYCYRSDLKTSGAEYHLMWRLPFVGAGFEEQSFSPEEQDGDELKMSKQIEETTNSSNGGDL